MAGEGRRRTTALACLAGQRGWRGSSLENSFPLPPWGWSPAPNAGALHSATTEERSGANEATLQTEIAGSPAQATPISRPRWPPRSAKAFPFGKAARTTAVDPTRVISPANPGFAYLSHHAVTRQPHRKPIPLRAIQTGRAGLQALPEHRWAWPSLRWRCWWSAGRPTARTL